MNWLTAPYWTPNPDLRNNIQPTAVNGWAVTTNALGVEGYLQSQITSTLSGISSWLDPNYYNPWPKTLEGIVEGFIWEAMNRIRWYPSLGNNIDPISLGTKYGQLFVSILKQIDSGNFNNGTSGTSLWDAWTK